MPRKHIPNPYSINGNAQQHSGRQVDPEALAVMCDHADHVAHIPDHTIIWWVSWQEHDHENNTWVPRTSVPTTNREQAQMQYRTRTFSDLYRRVSINQGRI